MAFAGSMSATRPYPETPVTTSARTYTTPWDTIQVADFADLCPEGLTGSCGGLSDQCFQL